jgi:hypothetical protein
MNDAQRMQQAGGVNVHATGTPPVEHWKYPETVGNDGFADDINFNSNATSEYAIRRMNKIDSFVNEPYVMFEFMTVDNDDFGKGTAQFVQEKAATLWGGNLKKGFNNVVEFHGNASEALGEKAIDLSNTKVEIADSVSTSEAGKLAERIFNKIKEWAQSIGTLVKRKYTGSIALYMPTDIQINDQMVYNDDSRKMGAFAETLFSKDYANIFNPVTLTSPTALALAGYLGGKFLPGSSTSMMSALAGAGLASVVQTELQRGSGKLANPNEILLYNSTTLRTFTFNWTILPDSQQESKHATGLIKMFRKSAHAKKDNKMIVTVPDHVIVSFHGAGSKHMEMIQLPPCVIESVNVTYNPNASSFFRENNAPVEIALSVGLKEMAPLYAQDVEEGY